MPEDAGEEQHLDARSQLSSQSHTSKIRGTIRPANLLFAARAVRDFGDGFVAVLLPVYLTALGFTPLQVGIIASVALLGSSLLTLVAGALCARMDHGKSTSGRGKPGSHVSREYSTAPR